MSRVSSLFSAEKPWWHKCNNLVYGYFHHRNALAIGFQCWFAKINVVSTLTLQFLVTMSSSGQGSRFGRCQSLGVDVDTNSNSAWRRWQPVLFGAMRVSSHVAEVRIKKGCIANLTEYRHPLKRQVTLKTKNAHGRLITHTWLLGKYY